MRLLRLLTGFPLCLIAWLLLGAKPAGTTEFVLVEQFEDINQDFIAQWAFNERQSALQWHSDTFGTITYTGNLSPSGKSMLRTRAYAIRLTGTRVLPQGEYELRLRSANHARLYVIDLETHLEAPGGRSVPVTDFGRPVSELFAS